MKDYKIDLIGAVSERAALKHVSIEVQKHAIKLGYEWDNEHPKEPRYLPSHYLFTIGGRLTHGPSMTVASFQEHPNELITVEDFLLIQPEHEGIKMTKQEAQIRMIKGERPFSGERTYCFDELHNRFVYYAEEPTRQGEIHGFWNELDEWQWPMTFERSGECTPCWVSNVSAEKRIKISVVKFGPETGEYTDKYDIPWKYATPVKPEECWGYKDD